MQSYSSKGFVRYIWQATVDITIKDVRSNKGTKREADYRYINPFFKKEGSPDMMNKQPLMKDVVDTITKESGLTQTNAYCLLYILIVAVIFGIIGVLEVGPEDLKTIISTACYVVAALLIVLLCVLGVRGTPDGMYSSSAKRVEKYMEKHKDAWEVTLSQVGYQMTWKIEEKSVVLVDDDPYQKRKVEYKRFFPYMEIYFQPTSGMGMRGMNDSVNGTIIRPVLNGEQHPMNSRPQMQPQGRPMGNISQVAPMNQGEWEIN